MAVPRHRLVLLAGGGVGLLVGLWTGLVRAGVHDPLGPFQAHGIITALGFLGTLIALERAVALGGRWPSVAPALSGGSVLWLVAGLPAAGAGALLTVAGLVFLAAAVTLQRRQASVEHALQVGAAAAWVVAAALWASGTGPVRLAPLLAAFLVVTIVAERLELSRLGRPPGATARPLVAAVVVFAGGCLVAVVHRQVGLIVGGLGLLAQTAWLVRHDIARRTVARRGLPRFCATSMLAAYLWAAVAGVLWVVLGSDLGGWLVHDAALHALFLGFVLSMVVGHAPIIVPAILRVPIAYHPVAYVPLLLLHASVALRVGADLAGSAWLRGYAAHGNVTALLLLVVVVVGAVRTARRRGSTLEGPA